MQKINIANGPENASRLILGIEGDYEGIGHCALGYAAEPLKDAALRKTNYVYYVE